VNSLVVDTDVVSYVFRNHSAAALYIPIIENHKLWISFMTRAEIRLGARKANWGPRTLVLLDQYLSNYETRFPDEQMCDIWADVCPIDSQDAWIAATAIELDVPLVTNNVRHFRDLPGLTLRPAR